MMTSKVQVGHCYKTNWFTEDDPDWGYFYVIKKCTGKEGSKFEIFSNVMGYMLDECSPYGGHWIHWRPPTELTRQIEVPALVAAHFLFLGCGEPSRRRSV